MGGGLAAIVTGGGLPGRDGRRRGHCDRRHAERRGRHQLIGGDLLLQQRERDVDIGRQIFRLGNRQTIECKTVTRASLRQRLLHPGDGEIIFRDPCEGVEPLWRRNIGDQRHRRLAFAVGFDDAVGDVEKRPYPHDVVANVVVEPIVASRGRTIIGGEKLAVIGRRIDDP
jgi:hypothetical protein